jgi:hypothetical protein
MIHHLSAVPFGNIFSCFMAYYTIIYTIILHIHTNDAYLYDTPAVPFGNIFSCFMACCLLGSTAFGALQTRNVPVEKSTSGRCPVYVTCITIIDTIIDTIIHTYTTYTY